MNGLRRKTTFGGGGRPVCGRAFGEQCRATTFLLAVTAAQGLRSGNPADVGGHPCSLRIPAAINREERLPGGFVSMPDTLLPLRLPGVKLR